MASAEAVGGAPEKALDAACAVEFVHVFSLIHDDLPAIDNDDLRRGRPTCHKVYGEALALLAGDALFARAFEVLSEADYAPPVLARAMRALAPATGTNGLVGGEVMDVLNEGAEPNLAVLRDIHARKTGALIAVACELGGIVGGGSQAQSDALRRYGAKVGVAFQIADDVLNETSTAAELGKAVGSDRARGKVTYPSLMGIEESKRLADETVESALGELVGLPGKTEALAELARFSVRRSR